MTQVFGNIRHMWIFTGVPLGGGIKWQWGCQRRQYLAIWVATSLETSVNPRCRVALQTTSSGRNVLATENQPLLGFSFLSLRIYDFLLVRHSNLGPILHHFGDIAGFLCSWPHPYSALILGVFSLHQIAHVGVSPHTGLKLFGREIIFQEFQPMWSWYLNVTDRRTDRQYTIAIPRFALKCIAR